MTGRKRKKDTPTAGASLLDASTKHLAEYSHGKISDEGIDPSNIRFEDLFELDDIQRTQDSFARATGVAFIITTWMTPLLPSVKP